MRRIALAVVLAVVGATVSGASSASAVTPSMPGTFVPLTQTRVLSVVLSAHGSRTSTLPGVPTTAEAAEVTVTVFASTASGGITAAKPGPVPAITDLTYRAGQVVTNTAVVALTNGQFEVYNSSAGTAHVMVDLQGYYVGGDVSTTTPGLLHVVVPKRMVNSNGPIAADKAIATALAGGTSPIPAGAGQAVVTVTVTSPTKSGAIIAYLGPRPTESTLHFTAGQVSTSTAVVPLTAGGTALFYNASAGTVKLTVDVLGYLTAGDNAALAGALQTLPVARAYSHSVGAKSTTSIALTGHGGVPVNPSLVTAVLVVVHVSFPTAPGLLVVYKGGLSRPAGQNVSFGAGQTTSNVLQVPVSSTGAIFVYDSAASGTATLTVDIYGYVRATTAVTPPPVSTGRYVRDITNTSIGSMQAQGQADQSSKLVLLEFGVQTDDKVGVELTTLNTPNSFVPYSQLTLAINAYLSGFGAHAAGATVAIGTNNDLDAHATGWNNFSADARGQRWAQLLTTLTPPAGVTVVGADDIESGFYSTQAQAQAWENGYLGATAKQLIFNGSTDGCPQTLGSTGACNFGWTPAQIYGMAHNGSRIVVLPQIYYQSQANQWANVDEVGGRGIVFAGVLDEFASEPGVVFMPAMAYQSFYNALSGVVKTPSLPTLVDLQVDG